MGKRVTVIPATLNRYTSSPVISREKKKVAGYARVSTDTEEQQQSYENQVKYYEEFIKNHEDWEFVEIYTDEGISGTGTARREGFKRMIEDALAGKINLIVTKSISRFARNTVDSLTTIRLLKENGVEIYFEKENVWTFDEKVEIIITIMSSLAQEESRSIAENTSWGKRQKAAKGEATVAFTRFLGYDKGFIINEEEAITVRLIYKMFLSGLSMHAIKKELTAQGRKTATGKTDWCISSVKSILTNEKYKGDALLQKEYTKDFLTKKRKKNYGEVPQYYVEDHHMGIIDKDTFDLVQLKIKESKNSRGNNIFCSKIKCGDCGNYYTEKVWHSTDKYRRVIHQCGHKYSDGSVCHTPHLTLEEIQTAFISAVNKLTAEKEEMISNLIMLMESICGTEDLEKERDSLADEVTALETMLRDKIAENARTVLNQQEYESAYRKLYAEYEEKEKQLESLNATIEKNTLRQKQVGHFIKRLDSLTGMITVFDDDLWGGMVDCMTVYSKDNIVVTFIGGLEVKA